MLFDISTNICKVYEIGELPNREGDEEFPYIAMQLIAGKPLHHAAVEMTLYEKVRVIKQVAEALHVAHRQGLVHRDIKPSKVTRLVHYRSPVRAMS